MDEISLQKAIAYFEKTANRKVFSIKPLGNGTANDIFQINWEYVCRIKKENKVDEPFNTPGNEAEVLLALAMPRDQERPYRPHLCVFDPVHGDKIEMFIDSKEELNQLDSETEIYRRLLRASKSISELHRVKGNIAPFEATLRYQRYKGLSGESLCPDWEKVIVPLANDILLHATLVLSHNDLWSGNVLFPENSDYATFVDYEFAGLNAEAFDLASLIEENDVDERHAEWLMNDYVPEFTDPKEFPKQVRILIMYQDFLWAYWALARYKETSSPRFFAIAEKKKKRIESAYKKFQENPGWFF